MKTLSSYRVPALLAVLAIALAVNYLGCGAGQSKSAHYDGREDEETPEELVPMAADELWVIARDEPAEEQEACPPWDADWTNLHRW